MAQSLNVEGHAILEGGIAERHDVTTGLARILELADERLTAPLAVRQQAATAVALARTFDAGDLARLEALPDGARISRHLAAFRDQILALDERQTGWWATYYDIATRETDALETAQEAFAPLLAVLKGRETTPDSIPLCSYSTSPTLRAVTFGDICALGRAIGAIE